ncbi:MAG: cbb3-type cytochrome c oxidase subunit I [Planctomycetes bacterium]|nr:cbb3-type cytochrome c oxidase subunit I [Planctomycetota bacterium]
MSDAAQAHGHHGHHEPASFVGKYIFALDHKIIAVQFMLGGLFFLLVGGSMALLLRWQLANPFVPVPVIGTFLFPETGGYLRPDDYNIMFTMHGTIMVFFAITPLVIGMFGNFAIPLQIGARDMAMPKVNMLSFWFYILGGIILLVSLFLPGGASHSGWTAYPPLSGLVGSPDLGQTFWILGLTLNGVSSLMGAFNYISTVVMMRTKGLTAWRLPLTVWGLVFTSILNLLFVPVVAAALILLLVDRTFGSQFFGANGGSTPLLFQHLFWFFGHPEVYILILPVWGLISDLIAVFSRKPAFGYKATVCSMLAITAISGIVWGHHMYTAGISPTMGKVFMSLTMLVSIPSAIFFLNWLGTLWRGSIRYTTPMLFCLGVVLVFSLGGLTGIFNAAEMLDVFLHDTYFVVGHFHLTMAASVLLGAFAGIYFWYPKMFGRRMNETLGKIHFAISITTILYIFIMMMILGAHGMMRRLADNSNYAFLKGLQPQVANISWAVLVLACAQLIFVFNFLFSLKAGPKAGENPWEAATLEWTTPSPPPHGNFGPVLPEVYRGAHEYSVPGAANDWVPQSQSG